MSAHALKTATGKIEPSTFYVLQGVRGAGSDTAGDGVATAAAAGGSHPSPPGAAAAEPNLLPLLATSARGAQPEGCT
jgi:hypothetical protein